MTLSLSVIISIYSVALAMVVLYLIFQPRLQFSRRPASSQDGHINFYTFGTGDLEKCISYTFRIMANQQKTYHINRQVNVLCNNQNPRLFPTHKTGILIAR